MSTSAPPTPGFGLLFDVRNPAAWERPWHRVVGEALDQVSEAECLGADSVWATEHHHFPDGYLSQPLTFLSAAAARTERVRLGTGVLLASLRHPQHVAEQAALVDQISNGRLELGIGAGYVPAEFATFGRDLGKRMTLADASIRALQELLWSPGLTSPPVQERLPLWLGYQGPQGAGRAGRLGVGLLAPDPSLVEPYRAGLRKGGHDPDQARMGGLVPLILAHDPERTAHLLAPHCAHQMQTYAQARTPHPVPPPDLAAVTRALRDPAGTGLRVVTVDEAQAALAPVLANAPIRHLYFWASVAAMPADAVSEHMTLAFADLAPRLQA